MLYKILHILLVLAAYFFAAGYILYRLKQTFSKNSRWFKASVALTVIMSFLLSAVMFLRIFNLGSWFLPFQTVSYLWFTIVFCAFAFTLLMDFVRFVVFIIRPLREKMRPHWPQIRRCYAFVCALLTLGLTGYGLYHFTKPKVKFLTIEIDKPVPDWKIVAISDLHLGTMSSELLKQHVDTINALQPDMVLMLGDQFVINWRDVVPMGYANVLRQIKAPQGVYAIHGNHEAYHEFSHNDDPRVARLFDYLHIHLLNDTAVVVGNQLALVGRADSSRRFQRAPLPELMENIPADLPIILMDHQPLNFAPAQHCQVDLQLSGHTHNGQFFPMNLFQRMEGMINGKLYYGYRQQGGTQFYVTSGLGGSGAPVRLGTDPEIVVIQLKQKTQ